MTQSSRLPPLPRVDRSASVHNRRRVTAVTLVVGTVLLGATLRAPRGSGWFTALGLAVAATWIIGAQLSGPIAIRSPVRASRQVVVTSALLGAAAALAFFGAYFVAQHVPVLSGALDSVLARADAGSTVVVLAIALVNGVGEELFFRGALYAALPPRSAIFGTTIVYVCVTAVTFNVALVIAALVMGTIFGLQRRATRSVLAPMVTHLIWSTLTLLALPR
jgi:membrane protease YdiL (CAAX protease family)